MEYDEFIEELIPKKVPIPDELANKIYKLEEKNFCKVDAKYAIVEEKAPSALRKKREKYSYLAGAACLEMSQEDIGKEIEKLKLKKSFSEMLFEIIDQKRLADADVYKKAYVDRRLFSKIRSNKDYHPSKGTVIQLCLALELPIKQVLSLLKAADYYLARNSKENLVIYYLFEHEIYDVLEANDLLYSVCEITIDKL